jgi:ParB-like nuclease domain
MPVPKKPKPVPLVAADPAFPAYVVVRVDSLIKYENNPRTHSDAQISQLVASIKEFGFTNAILTDGKNGVVAGHGRLVAAQKLGMATVPTLELSHLSAAQRRAYIIADNKLALAAGWDDDLLRLELGALREDGFDLSLIGFDAGELAGLFGEGGLDGAGSLAAQFGIPPFTVLNAREGWWQERKRAWLALGIRSEIGRGETLSTSARVGAGEDATYRPIGGRKANAVPGGGPMPLDRAKAGKANATPGGARMPAADYSKRQRGDGRGRAVAQS